MSEIDDGYIFHIEKIVCLHCGLIQDAKVEHSVPFFTYIHTCEECGYTIMESEWERVNVVAESGDTLTD